MALNKASNKARVRIGVVMDPIANIKVAKDTTLALMLEAQERGFQIEYMEMGDLYVRDGRAYANTQVIRVADDAQHWYEFVEQKTIELAELDVILMRKDPPFDTEYIYATYILELAQQAGSLIVNQPAALRNYNEKMAIARFPECCAPTLVARDMAQLRAFTQEQGEVVIKPLDGMGGASIFKTSANDPNLSVILETLTHHGQRFAMIQTWLKDIANGDKRIILINGQPMSHCLARIPAKGESRGNLAAGGSGVVQPISERDREIAATVGPSLLADGLLLVGLDVIGDSLTEINVTSPTCVREITQASGVNICGQFFDAVEERLTDSSES